MGVFAHPVEGTYIEVDKGFDPARPSQSIRMHIRRTAEPAAKPVRPTSISAIFRRMLGMEEGAVPSTLPQGRTGIG